MKISGPGPVSNIGKAKGVSKSGGDGAFGQMLDSIDEEKEVLGTGSLSRLNSINFINAIDGEEKSRRKKLIDDADDILDELGKIRDALLMGNLSIENLRSIQVKIGKIEANCTDTKLNEIVEEVKIRAAVELAKLGQY